MSQIKLPNAEVRLSKDLSGRLTLWVDSEVLSEGMEMVNLFTAMEADEEAWEEVYRKLKKREE